MITKSNSNPIPRFFLDRDNLIKGKMKSIIKLNSQLIKYLKMKKKTNFKILNLPDM